jgi:glycosyltransferase involved in cell wall biosynthesis
VLVIGDGAEREALLRFAHLELIGPRPDAGDLMAAADVIVCPSRTEGFPQTPLQAMFANVPVVATAVGGTFEIVDERVGVLVPPEDPTALGDAITALLADRTRARELGRRGRARIFEAGFTVEAMCARHEAIYRELLA